MVADQRLLECRSDGRAGADDTDGSERRSASSADRSVADYRRENEALRDRVATLERSVTEGERARQDLIDQYEHTLAELESELEAARAEPNTAVGRVRRRLDAARDVLSRWRSRLR